MLKNALTAGVFLLVSLMIQKGNCSNYVSLRDTHLVQGAELIFEGEVTDVAYKNSLPNESNEVIPHTFVTYHIHKIFLGTPEDANQMTLRFMGGVKDASKVLRISSMPLFDIGDRDILFVERNTEDECPLVGFNLGRYRIVQEKMYQDMGTELHLENDPLETSEILEGDILDPKAWVEHITKRANKVDEKIWNALSEESRELLETYMDLGAEELYVARFLISDFQSILRDSRFFSTSDFTDIALRAKTKALLETPVDELSEEQAIRRNRLAFEDLYGPSVFSLSYDAALHSGAIVPLDEAMTHYYNDRKITIRHVDNRDPQDLANHPVTGKTLTYTEFVQHLLGLITTLRNSEDLGKLPVVPSADIREDFIVPAPEEYVPILFEPKSLSAKKDVRQTLERDLYEQNGFNPVIPGTRE